MPQWDAWVERTLLSEGIVPATAIAHAKALRVRGFEHNGLAELLVGLGHAADDALVPLFARATGAPIWDGQAPDAALINSRTLGDRRAVPLRRERNTLYYATASPYDETLRDAVRFAFDAARAEPLVASHWQIHQALRTCREPEPETLADAVRCARTQSLAELQAEWERGAAGEPENTPLNRLAFWLLFDLVAGSASAGLRLCCFDPPRLDQGRDGSFEPSTAFPDLPAALHEPLSRRMQFMATGDGLSDESDGWIKIQSGPRGRALAMRLRAQRTARGRVVVVQHNLPWAGTHPDHDDWAAWRAENLRMEESRAQDRLEDAAVAARDAVHAAEALGERATLELVSSLADLAESLDRLRREDQARPAAERALELCRAHGLGSRCEGVLHHIMMPIRIDDLSARVAECQTAARLCGAPGPGVAPVAELLVEEASVENVRGRSEAALAAARAVLADDERWFGALTRTGHDALIEASLAHSALQQLAEARACGERALKIAPALGDTDGLARWALAMTSAAAGDPARAAEELSGVVAHAPPGDVRVRVDYALLLASLGKNAEAREIAQQVLPKLTALGALTADDRRALEALLHDTGPYR